MDESFKREVVVMYRSDERVASIVSLPGTLKVYTIDNKHSLRSYGVLFFFFNLTTF